MKYIYSFLVIIVLFPFNAMSQSSFNYELSLVPVTIQNLPGLHSYAYAQHQGKWLIIGGRKDGLHARQPFNTFPPSLSNTDIYVVDVAGAMVWSAPLDDLSTSIKEQLQSTNMNFYQLEDTLYIIGGYGFSVGLNNHLTFPYLTTVSVSALMAAVENNQSVVPHFKQIEDSIFAVTGGHLKRLNNLFYLVGGHRFDGRYNPFGNPTYTQAYTNQIRKFSIDNSGNQLSISNYSAVTDAVHLRRRDYNLLPQILPDGQEGLMISSGVFQINADLPFLYPVEITANSYTPLTSFNQYLSNYHSAVACFYDSTENQMHSLFFGGMSQYYYQNDSLIQDDLVPFVKTISRLTRYSDGHLAEYKMPIEMPALNGSSAEFIPNLNLPHYASKIIKLKDINQNHFLAGHIFGGITSPITNAFSNNQTNLTYADTLIYEVWLTKGTNAVNENEINGNNPYTIDVYPNPFKDKFTVKFSLEKPTQVSFIITNTLGQVIQNAENKVYAEGEHAIDVSFKTQQQDKIIFLTVVFDNKFFAFEKLFKK